MHVNEVYKPTYNPGGPHCNHDSGFGRVSSLQISMFFFHDGHPKRRQTWLCFFLVGVRLRNARRKKHHLLVGFPVFLQDFSIAFSYL